MWQKVVQGSTARVLIDVNCVKKDYPLDANLEHYIRECSVYRRLGQHSSIVTLQQIQGHCLYLEAGVCLEDVISTTNVTAEQKVNWAWQLADGLQHMHRHGVIHADVRMANIIICAQGSAKWIDFGAAAIDNEPALGSYDMYSYQPQDPTASPTSKTTDIFAFGCTLYTIERGVPPYFYETRGMSADATMSFVEHKFSHNMFPNVDGLLFADIIDGCWRKTYRSMEEVRTALECGSIKPPSKMELHFSE